MQERMTVLQGIFPLRIRLGYNCRDLFSTTIDDAAAFKPSAVVEFVDMRGCYLRATPHLLRYETVPAMSSKYSQLKYARSRTFRD